VTKVNTSRIDTDSGDRELFAEDVHWLLNVAASALGERSAHSGILSVLQHGGFPSGVPETDIYSNYQMGWCVGDSAPERWRKAIVVWNKLTRDSQAVLLAHYCGTRSDLPGSTWARITGALGQFAMAAMWIHEGEVLVRLIDACVVSDREGRDGIIGAALTRTEGRVRRAHREWFATKELAGGPTA
jgi:hypothetical protein